MIDCLPEIAGQELAAGLDVGDGGTAVAGLVCQLLLADLGGPTQCGQVATEIALESEHFRRFQAHRSFPLCHVSKMVLDVCAETSITTRSAMWGLVAYPVATPFSTHQVPGPGTYE